MNTKNFHLLKQKRWKIAKTKKLKNPANLLLHTYDYTDWFKRRESDDKALEGEKKEI